MHVTGIWIINLSVSVEYYVTTEIESVKVAVKVAVQVEHAHDILSIGCDIFGVKINTFGDHVQQQSLNVIMQISFYVQ